MLYPRLTNCSECASIPELIKRIDCKLAKLGNSLYNNISYMLNQPIPATDILQLMVYKRILMYKNINPNYVYHYSISKIASKVILLTLGCESKLTYNPTIRVTTTTTTTPCPTTTTTTSSSSTTTTTTTTPTVICNAWYYNVTVYDCNCVEQSNSLEFNGAELNIGSFYYSTSFNGKIRVDSIFSPCNNAGESIWVQPSSESNTCAGVICPL